MKRFKRALVVILVPVVSVLIALEAILWIGHFIVSLSSTTGTPREGQASILCVGDSHTYGMGSVHPALQSYPSQLDQRLEALDIDVINKGVPSFNTSQMLESLPEWLEGHGPKTVIVLGGINNSWNLDRGSWTETVFGWSRVYKAYKLIRFRMKEHDQGFRYVVIEGLPYIVHEDGRQERLGDEHEGRENVQEGQTLRSVTHQDLGQMIEAIRAYGARPLLMTYASEATGAFVTVNDAIRDLATELDVPLVDHAIAFRRHIDEHGYEGVISPKDHHPIGFGYKLMVDHILEVMKQRKWLDEVPRAVDVPSDHPPVDMTLHIDTQTRPWTVEIASAPDLLYQLYVSDRKKEDGNVDITTDTFHRFKGIPQFNDRLDEDGRATFRFPFEVEGPVYIQGIVLDTSGVRGFSDVIEVSPGG